MSLLKMAKKLYHLSDRDLTGQTLTPRVPRNTLTDMGYEDGKTPRVSLSETIDGSLIGLSQNLDGKKLYVHEVSHPVKTMKPTVQQVPDVMHTKEIWALEPVTLKKVREIDVYNDHSEALPYRIGDQRVETFGWGYK